MPEKNEWDAIVTPAAYFVEPSGAEDLDIIKEIAERSSAYLSTPKDLEELRKIKEIDTKENELRILAPEKVRPRNIKGIIITNG